MLRVAVVDGSDERGKPMRLANPELLDTSAETKLLEEGSPCLPGVAALVKRPAKVTLRYLNADGVIDRKELDGMWARSVQHQIDHLNGRMYFDNLSKVKRDMLLKKAQKLR
jgi:peptide deformylase